MLLFRKNAVYMAIAAALGMLIVACEHKIPVDLPTNGGNGGSQNPTFSAIQNGIFARKCALPACHIGSATSGLDLSPGRAYNNLVNVNSSYGVPRVTPNDPGNSVLYQKVIGNRQFGARMPQGGSSLPASEINLIRDWINDGAPNN